MISIGIIANKGGQGKTSTSINLAHGLAIKGNKVLLVDCDDQGHLAVTFDVDTENRPTLFHLLTSSDYKPIDALTKLRPNLYGILSNETLYAGLVSVQNLADSKKRVTRLYEITEILAKENFDYVIFDGKPGQTDLTYNIIFASTWLMIPVDVSGSDFLGLASLEPFINSIFALPDEFDPSTGRWFDKLFFIPYFHRTSIKDSKRDLNELREQYGDLVTPPIRFSQAIANAPRKAQTIFEYKTIARNNGIEDFNNLVDFIQQYEKEHKKEEIHA